MKYMLLIYSEPGSDNAFDEAARQAMMSDYFAFTQRIVESGEMIAGEPLQGIETATTVTSATGSMVVTDGPFAETKEVLGGFYMVDVESETRAQQLASEIPTAKWGRIEVRPLMELPAQG
jgi:hypothetical protein